MQDDTYDEVIGQLTSSAHELASRVVDVVFEELPRYRVVLFEDAERALERAIYTAVLALRSGDPRNAEGLASISQTVHERFAANIPADDVVRAFEICTWQIHQRFLEIAQNFELDPSVILSGSGILWQLGDAITQRIMILDKELSVEREIEALQRRSDLIRRLLSGSVTLNELQSLDCDPTITYYAVRCRASRPINTDMCKGLEESGSIGSHRAILAIIDGECVGIVARPPKAPPNVLVALGPNGSSGEIPHSFTIADQIAHVGWHLRYRGVQTVETLSWRLAAVDHPEVSTVFRRKYLDRLHEEGEFGKDMEKSIHKLIANNMNVTRAAADLHLHANTLRYRLRRFTEITGVNLEDPATQIEVQWAFQLGHLPPWQPKF